MHEALQQNERTVPLDELAGRLGALRLRSPKAVRLVRESLQRHGQLTAAVAYRSADGRLELLDGFKRLDAGRELGWPVVRVQQVELDAVQAKAAVFALNQQNGLTELEEGWLIRSLYREDGLTQPQIAQLLNRHKSWVCRRLTLVEQLDEAVQNDVRLGLLAARTAVELGRLPRDNQQAAAELVARRGLTTKQSAQLVATLLAAPDDGQRQRILDEQGSDAAANDGRNQKRFDQASSSAAHAIVSDIAKLARMATRLQARLLEGPLRALGAENEAAVKEALGGLVPVLELLQRAAQRGSSETSEES